MTASLEIIPAFDYSGVPSAADRSWLRKAVTEVKYRLRCTVAEVVEAGKVLLDARRRLRHGMWRRWVEAEVGLPRRTTNRVVAVAKVFGRVARDVLNRFTPTALYRLAEPGVPQPIREYMVEQASERRDGPDGKVTAAEVGEVLTEYHAKTAELSRAEIKAMDLPDDQKKKVTDEEDVFAGENWLLLKRLIETNGTILISSTTDDENGLLSVSFTMIGDDGTRRSETADVPEKVLLKLATVERKKVCSKCGAMRLLDEFSKLKTSKSDGRNLRCKACERERVSGYEAGKSRGGGGAGMRPSKVHHANAG